jgi:signal transduction histidine kinase
LKSYANELEKLNASKDRLFSIIAHDLKSPFNSIVGFSELLAEQIRNNDYKAIQEYADIILQSSRDTLGLLSNLMDWSRSQTNRILYDPAYLEIASVIEQVVLIFSNIASRKSINLSLNLTRDIFVNVDKNMIDTVMRNLISNAIKYSYQGGEILLTCEKHMDEVIVSVSDSGTGMSPDRIDILFDNDMYYSSAGTEDEQGTGLGLIICKEFIEKHGGRIWVESEMGVGSTFYFLLPVSG